MPCQDSSFVVCTGWHVTSMKGYTSTVFHCCGLFFFVRLLKSDMIVLLGSNPVAVPHLPASC